MRHFNFEVPCDLRGFSLRTLRLKALALRRTDDDDRILSSRVLLSILQFECLLLRK